MKKIIKISILSIFTILMIGGFAPKVFAVTPLDVQFFPDPLFNNSNFLPEDTESGTVTVTNSSGEEQTILTEAINIFDDDNFGSLLNLEIKEGSNILFNNTLAYFFATAGEYSLGTIGTGETRIFTYTVTFINSSDNSYQGKTLGFDVCVGFEGGNTHCGNTVISDEHGDEGGGGSSSGGSTVLIIFNEQALNITNVTGTGTGVATITWNTNKLATSQVVYGLASLSPYTLTLTPPGYGYPFYTVEDETKVIDHSMLLTGLTPGATYKYRVVSRASPATVSYEHEFTVPLHTQTNIDNGLVFGTNTENNISERQGNVLGANIENVPDGGDSSTGNVLGASALGSNLDNIGSSCYLFALLILILIYLVWRLWLRRRYEKLGVLEEEIKNRFYLFFGGCSILAIIVCLIFSKYCPLPIFIISTVISICFYAYRKLRSK